PDVLACEVIVIFSVSAEGIGGVRLRCWAASGWPSIRRHERIGIQSSGGVYQTEETRVNVAGGIGVRELSCFAPRKAFLRSAKDNRNAIAKNRRGRGTPDLAQLLACGRVPLDDLPKFRSHRWPTPSATSCRHRSERRGGCPVNGRVGARARAR